MEWQVRWTDRDAAYTVWFHMTPKLWGPPRASKPGIGEVGGRSATRTATSAIETGVAFFIEVRRPHSGC